MSNSIAHDFQGSQYVMQFVMCWRTLKSVYAYHHCRDMGWLIHLQRIMMHAEHHVQTRQLCTASVVPCLHAMRFFLASRSIHCQVGIIQHFAPPMARRYKAQARCCMTRERKEILQAQWSREVHYIQRRAINKWRFAVADDRRLRHAALQIQQRAAARLTWLAFSSWRDASSRRNYCSQVLNRAITRCLLLPPCTNYMGLHLLSHRIIPHM